MMLEVMQPNIQTKKEKNYIYQHLDNSNISPPEVMTNQLLMQSIID